MKALGKFIERAMWFYPSLQIGSILFALVLFFRSPSWMLGLSIIFLTYFLSPILYHLFKQIIPIQMGRQKFGPQHDPCGWMIAHRLQMIYVIFPFLEAIINSLPGIYSNWLRLWGSDIGRMVYWAPDVKIWDRTHLKVGSRTFVGGSLLSCHLAIPRKDGSFEITFAPITIGDDAFISAQSNIGPGSIVEDKEFIKMMTQIHGRKRLELLSRPYKDYR